MYRTSKNSRFDINCSELLSQKVASAMYRFLPVLTRLLLSVCLLTPREVVCVSKSNDANTVRSKPGASPVESYNYVKEIPRPQTTSPLPDLPSWLKENKLDHFIPKLEKINLQTLITGYELNPSKLLLSLRVFIFFNKKGDSRCPLELYNHHCTVHHLLVFHKQTKLDREE